MNAQEKAKEILWIYQELAKNEIFASWDYYHKKCAIESVHLTINGLRITTGHLELNQLDEYEVIKDFNFWRQVISEIEKL